jgi:CheY-like chemotaxis protein
VNQIVALRLLEKRGFIALSPAMDGRPSQYWRTRPLTWFLWTSKCQKWAGMKPPAVFGNLKKKTGAHVPILAMTAHATSADRDARLLAGMDRHIAKPVE